MRRKSIRTTLYVISALVFTAGLYLTLKQFVLFPTPYTPPPTPVATTARPTPTITAIIPPSPTPYVKLFPVLISFPDQQRQCEIVPVGKKEDNEMETVDSPTLAAWYQNGPSPGEEGNAILNGHISWKGTKGTFSILSDMETGEPVVIEYEDGSYRYFHVESVDVYRIDDWPANVLNTGGETRMTLVTCLGDYNPSIGTSESRIVVICKPDPES